jgi:F0F1-type ATP synthase membrane subunit b/b'
LTVIEIIPDFSSVHSVVRYFSTLGVHIAIFLIAFFCLNRLVFGPILRTLKLRRERIDEAEAKMLSLKAENGVLLEEFKWRMDGASQLAAEKKEITELIGKRRAEMLLLDVRRETNRDLNNVTKSAEEAYVAVEQTVKKDISTYAKEITGKILGG